MWCAQVPAFSRALMCHVRKEGNLKNELMVRTMQLSLYFFGVRVLLRACGAVPCHGCRCLLDYLFVWLHVCDMRSVAECKAVPSTNSAAHLWLSQDVLLPDEVDAVLEAQHRPTYVLQVR